MDEPIEHYTTGDINSYGHTDAYKMTEVLDQKKSTIDQLLTDEEDEDDEEEDINEDEEDESGGDGEDGEGSEEEGRSCLHHSVNGDYRFILLGHIYIYIIILFSLHFFLMPSRDKT